MIKKTIHKLISKRYLLDNPSWLNQNVLMMSTKSSSKGKKLKKVLIQNIDLKIVKTNSIHYEFVFHSLQSHTFNYSNTALSKLCVSVYVAKNIYCCIG